MRGGHIVVFAGTAEGRRLVLSLCRRLPEGVVTASVATGWGRELLEAERPQNLRVREGRLDRGGIEAFLREEKAGAVVDATHPYAREVSENLRAACGALELPCLGLAREETDLSGCILAADIREAAEKCRELPGNILLATGAKELPAFCQALGEPGRVFPRVLPLAESLEQCRAAGIPAGSVIAIQGPFSRELNLALMEQFSISVLVTKDGGKAGGMPEKLAAAREQGARVVAIRRPTLPGAVCSMAEILARLTGEEELR